MKTLLALFLALPTAMLAQSFPDPAELTPHPELPDPLLSRDGKKVETAEAWKTQRRPEIQQLFEHYVYGKSPALPAWESVKVEVRFEKEVYGGKGILREVILRYPPDGAPPLYLLMAIPKKAEKSPVFLGLNFDGNHATTGDPDVKLSENWIPARYKGVVNNRATEEARGTTEGRWPYELALDRGYAMATLYHGDIDPDFADFTNGIHPKFYAAGQTQPGPSEWGTIAAWAWSLRLAASYLIADPKIDPAGVCVMGHSRNGKASLWAGATDERFALVVSNQSGCGGAALNRGGVGEQLVNINKNFPHWFCDEFPKFDNREDCLPVDQHELLALIAPRSVLVCSAREDSWADPEGEFGSCVGADSVYRLLGTDGVAEKTFPPLNHLISSRIGYHIRPGKHDVGPDDWKVFFDFADRQLKK